MISKEKKTAIINEYARKPGDTGSPEVQIASSDSKNSGADRSSEKQPEGSSLQKRTSEDGRSETWTSCIPEEDGSGRIPCTDCKTWHQKIRTQKGGTISALVLREGRKF